jgi:hypothetical protein
VIWEIPVDQRVREALIKTDGKLEAYNVYGLELMNGSRVLTLPGSDDSIRGLTWTLGLWRMRAARLSNDPIAALRPVRARRLEARFAMCPPPGGAPTHFGWPGIAMTHR